MTLRSNGYVATAAHPENGRCDYLANKAASGDDLLVDEEYEKGRRPT